MIDVHVHEEDICGSTTWSWCLKVDIQYKDGIRQKYVWFPKSQCEYCEASSVVRVPEWLVNKQGIAV